MDLILTWNEMGKQKNSTGYLELHFKFSLTLRYRGDDGMSANNRILRDVIFSR